MMTTATSVYVNSNYEDELGERKDRFIDYANNAEIKQASRLQAANNIAEFMTGEPVKIGHHSEKRHCRDMNKMDNHMHQSVVSGQKADYYRGRANGVGTAGISSSDPRAVDKLKDKLEALTTLQGMMKAGNKIIKSKKITLVEKHDQLIKLGLDDTEATKRLKPDFAGQIGFPGWELSNNNAVIRNVKKRIAELESLRESEEFHYECDNYKVSVSDARVMFEFAGKPSDNARKIIKCNGFKWSPSRVAWVRQATSNAIEGARDLIKSLQSLDCIY